MKAKLVFFSIPCADLERAISFYQTIFGWQIAVFDCENDTERMGMIETDGIEGCLFYHERFKPSTNGAQVSFQVNSIDETLEKVLANGSEILMPKCKIDCEGKGYCATFIDCEGNAIGLYSEK